MYFEEIAQKFNIYFIGVMNDKKFKTNTIARAISFVKFVGKQAIDKGLPQTIYFHSTDFNVSEEDTDNIYLTKRGA